MKSQVNDLANQLRNGSEQRTVDATVEFNRKKGVKKYFLNAPGQPGHGEFLEQQPMTEDDFSKLPLEEAIPAGPEKVLDLATGAAQEIPA